MPIWSRASTPSISRHDHFVHILHGLEHAFAAIALLVAVTQLHCLVDAGAGPAGHGGPANGPAAQLHFHFHRGVAPAVQNLTAYHGFDKCCHLFAS